jgi:hypothetical protein
MSRNLLTALALAASIGAGVLYGVWTDRWAVAQERMEVAAERFKDVPMSVEGWDAHEMEDLAPRIRHAAGVVGYLARRYVNRNDGLTATMFLFSGPPGPMSTHTPDRCLPGAGYRVVSAPTKVVIGLGDGQGTAEFWTTEFQRDDAALAPRLRAYWSWTTTGDWTLPSYPRLTFAQYSTLYKCYILHPVTSAQPATGDDAHIAFIRGLLPEIRQALFTKAE